jgi:hypothetical protein
LTPELLLCKPAKHNYLRMYIHRCCVTVIGFSQISPRQLSNGIAFEDELAYKKYFRYLGYGSSHFGKIAGN